VSLSDHDFAANAAQREMCRYAMERLCANAIIIFFGVVAFSQEEEAR
jgi:hypothetical protein